MEETTMKGIISKKVVGKQLANVAKKITEIEVNSACPLIAYQPQLPKSAKKLSRF